MAIPRVLILRLPAPTATWKRSSPSNEPAPLLNASTSIGLREQPALMHDYQILAIPGGFSYGDDVAAGKILANQLSHFLGDSLRRFRDAGKLVLGICNGFQVLLKAGLIVPPDEHGPLATLTNNTSGKFEDRWIFLCATPGKCPFLGGYRVFQLPVAHGEGNLICREPWILQGLEQAGQVVLRYVNAGGQPGVLSDQPKRFPGRCGWLMRCQRPGTWLDATPRTARIATHIRGDARGTEGRRGRHAAVSQCGGVLRLNSAKLYDCTTQRANMPWYDVIWNYEPGGNVEHIAAHGFAPEEVETVICDSLATTTSRSSVRPVATGYTSDGRLIFVVYEKIEAVTVYPVTAYEVEG